MTRIHIIGGPGSGKTTLARRFSTRLKFPFYELDIVGWEGGFGREHSTEYLTMHANKLIQCQRPSEVEACFYAVVMRELRSSR